MPRRGGQEVIPCTLSSWKPHYKTSCLTCDMKLTLLKLEGRGTKDVHLIDCVTELKEIKQMD